jgi:hypothetical protein
VYDFACVSEYVCVDIERVYVYLCARARVCYERERECVYLREYVRKRMRACMCVPRVVPIVDNNCRAKRGSLTMAGLAKAGVSIMERFLREDVVR